MKPWTGAVIWACPDCDGDLDEDAGALWCPACEAAVSYARAAEGA